MKLIIAGSRTIEVELALGLIHSADRWFKWHEVELVISGCAEGVDTAGEEWAEDTGIPVKRFPIEREDWAKYGKGAGPVRNGRMEPEADALLLIWDGKSTGSADMKRKMLKKKKRVWEIIIRTPDQVLAAESGNETAAMQLPLSG